MATRARASAPTASASKAAASKAAAKPATRRRPKQAAAKPAVAPFRTALTFDAEHPDRPWCPPDAPQGFEYW